jgi:hypothetical protein
MRARWRPMSMMSRLVPTLAALTVAVGVAGSVAACAHGEPSATASADASVSVAGPTGSAAGTLIGGKAFDGHGRLAFVSAGRLFVLDGSPGGQPTGLHAVATGSAPAGQTPGSPAWSPDGRWLAYLVGTPSADGAVTSGALWLAGPDGQGAHQVLAAVAGFAWSSRADELAATSADDGKLFAVQPGKQTYPMLEMPGRFDGPPVWSPNGREIAVASISRTATGKFGSSVIDLFVPSEGIVVNSLASSRTAALIVDGWWANSEGVLAWSDPGDAASTPADGLPLVSYPLGNAPTTTLASTPAYPSFAVPSGSGVTLVTGEYRALWNAKTITYCNVSGHCGPAQGELPAPVNFDPASSQWRGQQALAFTHCAAETSPASPQALTAWYRTCRLWYASGANASAAAVARAGAGVAAPTWSGADGDLLYVRDNALWLIPMRQPSGAPSSAPARPVVGRLFAGSWPNEAGYTAWQSQFAWHS